MNAWKRRDPGTAAGESPLKPVIGASRKKFAYTFQKLA
jgi:hypothetical protein